MTLAEVESRLEEAAGVVAMEMLAATEPPRDRFLALVEAGKSNPFLDAAQLDVARRRVPELLPGGPRRHRAADPGGRQRGACCQTSRRAARPRTPAQPHRRPDGAADQRDEGRLSVGARQQPQRDPADLAGHRHLPAAPGPAVPAAEPDDVQADAEGGALRRSPRRGRPRGRAGHPLAGRDRPARRLDEPDGRLSARDGGRGRRRRRRRPDAPGHAALGARRVWRRPARRWAATCAACSASSRTPRPRCAPRRSRSPARPTASPAAPRTSRRPPRRPPRRWSRSPARSTAWRARPSRWRPTSSKPRRRSRR